MADFKDYRMKEAKCPRCGRVMDGATNCTGDGAPSAGDFTVCFYCATILRFGFALQLEMPARADFEELMRQPPETLFTLGKIQHLVRARARERAGRN